MQRSSCPMSVVVKYISHLARSLFQTAGEWHIAYYILQVSVTTGSLVNSNNRKGNLQISSVLLSDDQ